VAEGTGGGQPLRAGGALELAGGALFIALVWGMAQPVIKASYAGLSPFALVWMRSALSALTLTAWIWLSRSPGSRTHESPSVETGHRALNGLLHNLYVVFLYLGMEGTTAARASVLLYTHPVWMMLLGAAFLPGERITPLRALGFAAAMAGTITVFSDRLGEESALWADGFIVLTAILWSLQAVHFKRCLGRSDIVAVTRWGMLLGAPLYLAFALLWEGGGRYGFGPVEVFTVFYMGVGSSGLVLVLWAYLLVRHSASKVSVFLFLTPAFGVGGSALLLGERVGWRLLAGAALTVAGVWLVTSERRGARPLLPPRPAGGGGGAP